MVDEKQQPVFDPTSLGAWEEHNTFTVMFSDKLGFTVKNIDVMQWMNEQKGNPLLATLQESMKSGDNPLESPDEKTTELFTKFINDLLIELVISPPLTEQGNKPEESLSLRNVSFAHKVMVFEELTGGKMFNKASSFREIAPSNVVAAPESGKVQ